MNKLTFKTLAAVLISSAVGASLDVNDPGAIAMAHQAAAANLLAYYKPNDEGTIPAVESEGRDGFQWFEMGMLWGAMMNYAEITKDDQVFQIISEALGNAGHDLVASFIGPKENGKWPSFGRWNDDIGWWAFAATSGAEIKGKDAKMPNGVPFLTLARNSWEQINEGVNLNPSDEAICRGGVFWHRNRNADKPHLARLLSTVTTAQYIFLSVRIYELTGDKSMLKSAQDAFEWLFTAKLIGEKGEVYDGVYNPRCWQVEKKEHSYNPGLFLGSAALLYKATKDDKYLERSSAVFSRFKDVFTREGIIIDECEPTQSCKVNQASFKGIAIRGLGHYFEVLPDGDTKTSIQNMIRKSAQGMATSCNDEWACNTLWTPGSPSYSDVHTQSTALELLNTLSLVSKHRPAQLQTAEKQPTPITEPSLVPAPVGEKIVQTSMPPKPAVSQETMPEEKASSQVKPAQTTASSEESGDLPFSYAASPYFIGVIPLTMGYLLVL